MPADAQIPVLLLLEFERERLRLCRDALRDSSSPAAARAWAFAVHDGERRIAQLAGACRELGADPELPVDAGHVPGLAAALVAEVQLALAGRAGGAAPPSRLAASSGAGEPWELRVG